VQRTKEMQSAFCDVIIHTIEDIDTALALHYILITLSVSCNIKDIKSRTVH